MDSIDFSSLIEDSSVMTDEDSLVRALRVNTKVYGFDHFVYILLSGKPGFTISSYPAAWQKTYFERCYYELDPIIQTARLASSLFAWSLDALGLGASPAQSTFFREADRYGIRSGISIPVSAGYGKTAVLTFASGRKVSAVDKIDPIRASIAATLVHAQMTFLHAAPTMTAIPRLSHRQATCLKWASEGKTMDEIGDIIGISRQSVRFHLDEARAKLDAVNLVQASSIAARHRLV